jgi:hypothetical protein
MVRLYIELDKLNENERVARDQMTADVLIAAANRVMKPYTLDVKEVAWWSVYEIGQRIIPPTAACRVCSWPAMLATPTARKRVRV